MLKKSFKIFISELLNKFGKKFFLLVFLLLLEGLILASSVLTIIPLADYLLDPELKNPSRVTLFSIKLLSILNINPSYIIFGSIFILVNFIRSFFALFIQYTILKIKYSITKNLTNDLLKSIFQSKWSFFNNLGPGKLLNTLNKELIKVGDASGHFATAISMFIQLITYLIIPFALDFKLTILTLLISTVLGLPFLYLMNRSHKLGQLNTSTSNYMMNVMNETIQAAKIILGFGNRNKAVTDNIKALDKHVDVTIKSQIVGSLTNLFFKPLAILAVIISIGISINVEKNISEYVAIFWSLYAVIPVLANLLNTNVVISNFLPSYEQLEQIRKKALNNKEISTGKEFKNFNEKITFEYVTFNYKGKENIIKDCSFKINKNEITAIIGKSGSGKSTIVDLILGLQKVNDGKILFDNKNELNEFNLDSYRNKVSLVFQDPFLFYTTIKENLLWSNYKASEKEIFESLKIANAYDLVMGLPKKLDTIVGERGLELSGGERQRIILARAILRKPQLLILDEATSSLDQESEKLIKNSIKEISKFTTVLIIAHRASAISIAQNIYVLNNGKMTESGNLDNLKKIKDSEFSKIMHEFEKVN